MGFSPDDMMKLANEAVKRPTLVLTEAHDEDGVHWSIGIEANPEPERSFDCCSLPEARRLIAFLENTELAAAPSRRVS